MQAVPKSFERVSQPQLVAPFPEKAIPPGQRVRNAYGVAQGQQAIDAQIAAGKDIEPKWQQAGDSRILEAEDRDVFRFVFD
ncbi:hypothetical protein BW247_06740 [Acidihalobacter ferrooxydans]|uniref:Uncharacterized protein n=1 Tax=Acidihalobacter ferrooxydans TaxID=1765967 RepID=A0A1P8UG61_9GAMM|nr:hypothetical protein BW247_06740 [Acidihalobacter ferrooxydans]